MKKKLRPKPSRSTAKTREPLAEGIRKKRRNWASMSDEELVAHTIRLVAEDDIRNRSGLSKAHGGLYNALRDRGLIERVGLDTRGRRWSAIDDEDLVSQAMELVQKNKITMKKQFQDTDSSFYRELRKRKLLDRLPFVKVRQERIVWRKMSDAEVVQHVREFMENASITGKTELIKADHRMYEILRKRGLIDRIGFEEKKKWAKMGDDELISLTKRTMEELGIKATSELKKKAPSLYHALRNRGLLQQVGFKPLQRYWTSDEELIVYAKELIREKKIPGLLELCAADSGLYNSLRNRGLLDSIGLKRRRMRWASMSDEELVGFARDYLESNGICTRKGLEKSYGALYSALGSRELRDIVFLPIEQANESRRSKEAIQQVVDAMEEFDSS